MNIAFPALLVFLLVLPGFVFFTSFRRAEKTQLDYKPFAEVTFTSLLAAAVLHFLWQGWLFLSGYSVNFHAILLLIAGQRESHFDAAVTAVASNPGAIFAYFFSLYVFAWLLGVGLRRLVVAKKWDRSGPFSSTLRFDTPWYYLFKGYDTEEGSEPDGVLISAIVVLKESSVLYTGVLSEYYFDSDGNLERLVLTSVSRRNICQDKPIDDTGENSDNRFYPIDGDYFVLRYAEVSTLNVQYFRLEQTPLVEAPADRS